MSGLAIDVTEWLGGTEDLDDLTFGSLLIREGDAGIALTEVQDLIAQATRPTIRVPAIRVARWLLGYWWRLRWEARPETPTPAWRRAHSMAALGDGWAWPPLEIASDGQFVQISMASERDADVAAIRYLRDVTIEVAATDFERAVDHFVDKIESRLDARVSDRELSDLRAELRAERNDPETNRRCRWEARAGYDPGDAPDGWYAAAQRAALEAGEGAIEDLLAVDGQTTSVHDAISALKQASTTVDLPSVPTAPLPKTGVRPWEWGVAAARAARSSLGLGAGPVSTEWMCQQLGKKLPLPVNTRAETPVLGGYRARDGADPVRVLVGSPRRTSQRFYFARLVGMASQLSRADQVLPITAVGTAMQKFGRSFAQEFLCPWDELAKFADEHGVGENAIARAAEHYDVSDMLITTKLVNHGRLDRTRLTAFEQ